MEIAYHVSLCLNRESIIQNGLNFSGISPWEDEYPKGNYLWFSLKDAKRYGFGNGDPFDIWEVNISEYEIENDPITKNAILIKTPISTKDISLLEKHEKDVSNPID